MFDCLKVLHIDNITIVYNVAIVFAFTASPTSLCDFEANERAERAETIENARSNVGDAGINYYSCIYAKIMPVYCIVS